MNWNTCGGYMKAKNEKLDNIHNKNVDNNYLQKTEIFKNVAIYVTGYTVPSYNEIRKIIIENGGKFIHNYSKSKVTFIIATNVYGGNNSTHFPKDCIVRPKWIIDSLNQKKCLPVHEYTLFKQETIQQIPNTHENSETDEEILHILPDSIVKNDISSFYQHSRLHVMSTLLVDLKIFVSNYHKYFDVSLCQNLKKFLFEFENNQDEFDTIENQPTLLNTYLYLDMDCFFASVSLIGKDHWQCQPVVVSHGRDQNSMSEISSCNYVARKLGIRNGMLLKIAFKKCPHLIIGILSKADIFSGSMNIPF
ncbi:hypothetical protein A3Q56_06442 [Intoshia linei]|uniref:DNA repair protein REV1 n=1 Tax=Intoshia linei TaxID=1819745 RepID=A0A177AWV3_9BILA|nr:hypothetical protein A3Q56_06442 [Intoshia linei]